MARDTSIGPAARHHEAAAGRIARRVAFERELRRLTEGFAGHDSDAAAVLATIGAVGAAVIVALMYLSLG
jgi:hypothetical protein